jgi:hypothetical protein
MSFDDFELENTVGNAKSIQTERADLIRVSGSIVERDRELDQIVSLDNKGRVAEVVVFHLGNVALKILNSYDPHGKLVESLIEKKDVRSRTSYLYDESDKLTTYLHHEANGQLEEKASYLYDADGVLSEIIYRDGANTLNKKMINSYGVSDVKTTKILVYTSEEASYLESVLTYSKTGKLVENTSYNVDGEQQMRMARKYNGNDNCIEQIWYNSNGSISAKEVWEYDEKGLPIRELKFSGGDSLTEEYSIYYEFDRIGNWTKRTHLKDFPVNNDSILYVGVNLYRTIAYLL